MHSGDENENTHKRSHALSEPSEIIEKSKWEILSGTYTIKAPKGSRSDPGIGNVDVYFVENSVNISNFTYLDVSKLSVFNEKPTSDEELQKMHGSELYASSPEFGEQQLVCFIKD